MPVSLTLPTDGQSDWDVPLNEALTDLETFVNGLETTVGGKLDTTAAAELIRDTIGSALVAGTNVTITVDDSGNTITIAATGSGGLDAEGVRDTIAAALVPGTGISITVNDAGDTITIDATGGGSAPDATASVKGIVQLAGDLGGTAAAPTVVAASTTVAGKVELATTAETTTGTDTVRAVTPAGVKAVADTKAAATHTHAAGDVTSGTLDAARLPAASDTAQGVVELATATEASTGTDTARAVTAAGVKQAIDDRWQQSVFSYGPTLVVGAGSARLYNRSGRTRTIRAVDASVGTAPTGAAAIVDVNKNGTTIFTTQSNRPQIAVSTFEDMSGTPDVTTWADGDYLTMDIDQIGSMIAGAALTLVVYWS